MFMQDNSGKIREWAISVEDYVIVIEHGEKDGAMLRVTEEVEEGKATRTREEQIMSRIASRISKQRDKGYRPELPTGKATNILGYAKPMLAAPLKNCKGVDYKGAYVQRKYDGNRCLITCQQGTIIAYTRNGKPINTIGHILDGLELLEGQTIDGELYCHGHPLQTIVSWIKRGQADTLKIKYHMYDMIADVPYSRRYAMLNMIPLTPAMEIAETIEVQSFEEVQAHFKESRELGYEGSIVRLHNNGYEDGKRSKSLIKVKSWEDDNFVIVDIVPSKDGWAILVCLANNGARFRVTCPGPVANKHYVMENKAKYLGTSVRVEYAQLTTDGIPFHPVATLLLGDEI